MEETEVVLSLKTVIKGPVYLKSFSDSASEWVMYMLALLVFMPAGIHKGKSTVLRYIVILVTFIYIKFLTTFKCFVEKSWMQEKVVIVWFYYSWIALMFILFLLLVTDSTASYM